MTDVNPKTLERLSSLARRRIIVEARLDKLKQHNKERLDAIKTAYHRRVTSIERQARQIDGVLWRAIDKHRQELTPSGERSFATRWVKFQFKHVGAVTKVKEAGGVIAVARRRGALKKIASPTWALDEKRLLAYLEENPDERKHYQEYLEEVPQHETLSIKLNEGHDVTFDNKKLSPKAVSVKKS